MKPKCPDHGYDVGMCCQNCYCLKCPLCEDDKICKGTFDGFVILLLGALC